MYRTLEKALGAPRKAPGMLKGTLKETSKFKEEP